MTKVLFVHDGPLYKDKSGNYYGIHLNDELRKRYLNLGDTVTFIMRVYEANEQELSRYSKLNNENLKVIEIPNFKSFRLYLKNRKKVNRIVENAVKQHDIIMSRLPSATGSLSVKYALRHQKPLLTEVVACNWDSFWNYSLKGKLVAPYFYFKQKWIMKRIKYAIYVTKYFLQKRYPSDGNTINCSNVELKQTESAILNQRIQKIENFNKDSIVIGTVAAIDVPYKGQSDVIKAVAELKKKGINVIYKIVGQGNPAMLNALIEKLDVSDNVQIIGALKHHQIFDFMDELDLYIQPSKQEGLPRAMIEAMSRACPCLGANTAGIPELIPQQFIFGKGNVKEIVKLISKTNKESLLVQAKENYHTSFEYQKTVLDNRRFLFYKKFLMDYHFEIPSVLKSNLAGENK